MPPTPPSTVWITPVERWTLKPISTRRSITASICCSVAPCCITTNIYLAPVSMRVALNLPHFVDDALEDATHRGLIERPLIGLP